MEDLGVVAKEDLPARLDWSIMGCTILRRALMNLEEMGGDYLNK